METLDSLRRSLLHRIGDTEYSGAVPSAATNNTRFVERHAFSPPDPIVS
jgi:hypothetical protein